MNDLQRLFQAESIAVIGGKWAAEVIRQCVRMGYRGDIWPVHPRHDTIESHQVYRSIESLPSAPDAAFIGVNRETSVEIMEALAKRGCGGAVCFSSGFEETLTEHDQRGATLQQALLEASGEMPFLGPNCYGFINYCDGVLLWPDEYGGVKLEPGCQGAAVITQSSNIAINISMQSRGLPLAYLVTVGNQSKIGLSEIGLALLDDTRVSCLGLYVEGFDSIEGMQKLALKAFELGKPIAILKAGKSEQAQLSTFSHTASLAGAYENACTFIKHLGMAQVTSIPGLLDALLMLHTHGPLPGFTMGAMVCSGGEASLIADIANDKKVSFPPLLPAAKQMTQKALGPRVTVANPLDFHTYIWGDRASSTAAFEGFLSSEFDLNILILDFPAPPLNDSDWHLTAEAFLDAKTAVNRATKEDIKTALVSGLPENLPNNAKIDHYLKQGLPCFGGFEQILDSAEAAAQIGEVWQDWRINGAPKPLYGEVRESIGSPDLLDEHEAKNLLSSFGVVVPENCRITRKDGLLKVTENLGFPVAIKALGLAHKTECNALRLGVSNQTDLLNAANELFSLSEALMVEKMIKGAVGELLIGVMRDPQFGLVMTLAAGGVFVELLDDQVSLLLPTHKSQIQSALNNLKIAPLFKGFRGQPAWDLEAVIKSVLAVERFALAHRDRLLELDINPLMVGEQDSEIGAIAVDALIILRSEE